MEENTDSRMYSVGFTVYIFQWQDRTGHILWGYRNYTVCMYSEDWKFNLLLYLNSVCDLISNSWDLYTYYYISGAATLLLPVDF